MSMVLIVFVNFDKFKCRPSYLYFKRKYTSHLIKKYLCFESHRTIQIL